MTEEGRAAARLGDDVRRAAAALAIRDGKRPLTERELDVLCMSLGGLTRREMADSLGLSTKTIEAHLYHATLKFGRPLRLVRAELIGAAV